MVLFMENISKLKDIINESSSIVVFTGAGISCPAPTNIPDFRGSNGLYSTKSNYNYSPEEIISHSFFLYKPELFFEFYFSKMVYEDAIPNLAHTYFANLEKIGKVSAVVTQNIDGLHQKAGSKNVYELHGSVHRNYCVKCHKFYSLKDITKKGIPYCDCGGIIKPDVVLYEEPLDEKVVMGAIREISKADTMIVLGTSLSVYPAASYLRYFKGNHIVLINKQKTAYDDIAELVFNCDMIDVIKELA